MGIGAPLENRPLVRGAPATQPREQGSMHPRRSP